MKPEYIGPYVKADNKVLSDIRTFAEESYPNEGCGVLLNKIDEDRISESVKCQNLIAGDKADRFFLIDPLELLSIEKKAEQEGFEIAGFFHTHPDHEAVVSSEDERYMISGLLYMIVPVKDDGAGEVRIYTKDDPFSKEREIGLKEGE